MKSKGEHESGPIEAGIAKPLALARAPRRGQRESASRRHQYSTERRETLVCARPGAPETREWGGPGIVEAPQSSDNDR